MAPLTASAKRAARASGSSASSRGYWTHAGYMNWDSGLGFERWHQAQEARAHAAGADRPRVLATRCCPGKRVGPVGEVDARQRLRLLRAPRRARKTACRDPVLFDVDAGPAGRRAAPTWPPRASRPTPPARSTPASARRRAATPPPLYAYDPDIGRLAVTTPTYNTAIVAVNQRAFPYGGLDLARLFDGQQEVAANIGGRAPASFGLLRPRRRRPRGGRVAGRPPARRARRRARCG